MNYLVKAMEELDRVGVGRWDAQEDAILYAAAQRSIEVFGVVLKHAMQIARTTAVAAAVKRAKESKAETRADALAMWRTAYGMLPTSASHWDQVLELEAFLRDGYIPQQPEVKVAA